MKLTFTSKKFKVLTYNLRQILLNKMPSCKLNLIAAACENMGIGVKGTLPWRLRKEMAYFTLMTTNVKDKDKKNAVVMGRTTWECIPLKYRPLRNRVNIVLTHDLDKLKQTVPKGVIVVGGLDEAVKYIEGSEDIESTWVIGGASIYKAAMSHPCCGKIYLTEIQKQYVCDTFFPSIDTENFELVTEDGVPEEIQTDGDVQYYFKIYKRRVM